MTTEHFDNFELTPIGYSLKVQNTLIRGFKTKEEALNKAIAICTGLEGIEQKRAPKLDVLDWLASHKIFIQEEY